MNATNLPRPQRPRYPWRILLLAAVTLPLLAAGGWVGICLLDRLRASWEVQAVVAELDRDDPGWTLEEILARREAIPDERNGALVVSAVAARMPEEPPAADEPTQIRTSMEDLDPCLALDAVQVAFLRSRLKKAEAALREALRLADFPRGRYRIAWLPNPLHAKQKPAVVSREVVELLADGVQRFAHDKDWRGACRGVRAMLHVGQYLDGEPGLGLYVIRVAELYSAVRGVERILGQGQPAPDDLLALQRLLEAAEQGEPAALRTALRGDRARVHWAMRAYDRGEVPSYSEDGSPNDLAFGGRLKEFLLDVPPARRGHARYLRRMTAWVAQCGRPFAELADAGILAQFDLAPLEGVTRVLNCSSLGGSRKILEFGFHLRAALRCATASVAAERYRRDQGKWPAALANLVPHYLRAIPADPFDGQPLRFKQLQNGVVIYSVGPDRTDNGGTLNRLNPLAPGSDVGFQLWDAAKRGRPAPAK